MGEFRDFVNTFGREANDLIKAQKRSMKTNSYPLPNNPAVTLEVFSSMLEQCQKNTVTKYVLKFQKTCHDEDQFKIKLQVAVEMINTKLSNEITSEIRRLGRDREYEKIISEGVGFASKLSFWNNYIPNLKEFLSDSFNKVSGQVLWDINYVEKIKAEEAAGPKPKEMSGWDKHIWTVIVGIVIIYIIKSLMK